MCFARPAIFSFKVAFSEKTTTLILLSNVYDEASISKILPSYYDLRVRPGHSGNTYSVQRHTLGSTPHNVYQKQNSYAGCSKVHL